jgi:5-methylcytosine-specific restriction endonuclease McrA
MMDYQEYLKSREWEVKRQAVLMWWGYKCALCNTTNQIEVHHNNYDRVGKELFTDLIPLCDACHTRHHGLPGSTASMLSFLEATSRAIKAGID